MPASSRAAKTSTAQTFSNLSEIYAYLSGRDRKEGIPDTYAGYVEMAYDTNSVVGSAVARMVGSATGISARLYESSGEASKRLKLARHAGSVEAGLSLKAMVAAGTVSEIEDHPILDALRCPNDGHQTTWEEWQMAWTAQEICGGQQFFYAERGQRVFAEPRLFLYLLPRPDRVRIDETAGRRTGYHYSGKRRNRTFEVGSPLEPYGLHHAKLYDPAHPETGRSPLRSLRYEIAGYNLAMRWNNAFLRNGAKPSGFRKPVSNSAMGASRTRDELQRRYGGPENAGRVVVEPYEWEETGKVHRDMDWKDLAEFFITRIAAGLGVDPILLGMKSASSYNNQLQAERSLIADNTLPRFDRMYGALNTRILRPVYGDRLSLAYDVTQIAALRPDLSKLASALRDAYWLTDNEKRALTNLPAIQGGEVHRVPTKLSTEEA